MNLIHRGINIRVWDRYRSADIFQLLHSNQVSIPEWLIRTGEINWVVQWIYYSLFLLSIHIWSIWSLLIPSFYHDRHPITQFTKCLLQDPMFSGKVKDNWINPSMSQCGILFKPHLPESSLPLPSAEFYTRFATELGDNCRAILGGNPRLFWRNPFRRNTRKLHSVVKIPFGLRRTKIENKVNSFWEKSRMDCKDFRRYLSSGE